MIVESAARPRVCLIVPTLNEQDAIGAALSGVPRETVDEIIIADSGSTDLTAIRATAAGARVIDAGRGYGRACLAAATIAGDDCAILVFMDGDGSDRADYIPNLVAPIVAGTHDFVIASRVRGEREPGSMAWHQLLAGIVIGWMVRWRYGVRYTDMCAFRAIRRRDLLALGMREMTYGWNLEMQMLCARNKLRVLELAVPYRNRAGGESKVAGSVGGSIRAAVRIVQTFFRVAVAER